MARKARPWRVRHTVRVLPAAFDAYRTRVEEKSAWPRYPRRKRLALVGLLTVEFSALFALSGWAIHRYDPDPAAAWVVLAGAASVPFLRVQLAFWPRGALSRTAVFVPVWGCLWFLGMLTFIVVTNR